MIIFTVKNKMNGDIFVGTTGNDLDTQWKKILTAAELDLDYPLYRQIRCHGADQFLVEEWDCAENRRELNQLEQDAIETLGAQSLRGYKTALNKVRPRVSTRKVGNAKFQAMEKELAQMIFGDGDSDNEPGLFDDIEIPTPKGRLIKANELDEESSELLDEAEPSIAELKASSTKAATAPNAATRMATEEADPTVPEFESTPAPKKKSEIKVVTKKRTRVIKNCKPTTPKIESYLETVPAVEPEAPASKPEPAVAEPVAKQVEEPVAETKVAEIPAQPANEPERPAEPETTAEPVTEASQEIIIPAPRPWQKPKLEIDDDNIDSFLADVMSLMEPEASDAEVISEEPLSSTAEQISEEQTAASAEEASASTREPTPQELQQQRIRAAITAQRELLASRTQADIDQQRAALAAQLAEFNQRAAELQSRSSCLH